MKLFIDIECNSLTKPDKIHLIVLKETDSGRLYTFRNVQKGTQEAGKCIALLLDARLLIGHNILGYDLPVLSKLLEINISIDRVLDTLVLSRLVNFSRPEGHSLGSYGIELGYPKLPNHYLSFFSKWSQELEDYCVRDVEICERIYNHFLPVLGDTGQNRALATEQQFQVVVNSLRDNGFGFDIDSARRLLDEIKEHLEDVDKEIKDAFPPQMVVVKLFTPTLTKYGTINKTSVPQSERYRICDFKAGETYEVLREKVFNPDSHKQRIDILTEAGWKPFEKTTGHKLCEREVNQIKKREGLFGKILVESEEAKKLKDRLEHFKKYGWVLSEDNLETLPVSAPAPARFLARHVLLESRRRKLVEWIGLYNEETGRIHGKFIGIGSWTHRMAHQEPNMANVPREDKLYGKDFRILWRAPKGRLLVGVDAEGIQFRIFAHYVDNKELTNAIIKGSKADKSDPHSFNQRILGGVCKSRQAAKRFIYSLFLGAGIGKLSEILECSQSGAEEALHRILRQYPAFQRLREDVVPDDAKKGYFIGLDGRKVRIPGDTFSKRKHLCMSGYLQNGEKVCIAGATNRFVERLKDYDAFLVDIVHDEWQIEGPDNLETCIEIGKLVCKSLEEEGVSLGLKCPLAGSFYNDDLHEYTIGPNWLITH